jgi:hypothetical protein
MFQKGDTGYTLVAITVTLLSEWRRYGFPFVKVPSFGVAL